MGKIFRSASASSHHFKLLVEIASIVNRNCPASAQKGNTTKNALAQKGGENHICEGPYGHSHGYCSQSEFSEDR